MKKNILTLVLIGFLTLGFVGFASADIIYPDELNIESMSIVKTNPYHNTATIHTKDGKCFMYKIKDGKILAYKTCDERAWIVVK